MKKAVCVWTESSLTSASLPDLQTQYSNFKNALQQIGQKIGDVEQEAEEHKSVEPNQLVSCAAPLSQPGSSHTAGRLPAHRSSTDIQE